MTTPAAYGPPLADRDVADYDAAAVPQYVRFFDALCASLLVTRASTVAGPRSGTPGGARVAVFGCRTGAAQEAVASRLESGDALVGVDASEPAIWSARLRDAPQGLSIAYEHAATTHTPLGEASFTHAVAVHPLAAPSQRAALFAEMRRVLQPGGQVVVALPVRGSFPELLDLVREFSLKHDKPAVAEAADRCAGARVSIETLHEDLEAAGFVDVDVDVQLLAVPFATGKAFAQSPVSRLVVGPDLGELLAVDPALRDRAVAYAADAIGKYWSESAFELAVNLGGASGWVPGEAPRGSIPPGLLSPL